VIGVDIKMSGRTISVDEVAVGRFITTRVMSEEEIASVRGIVKAGIKSLLKGDRELSGEEARILADYALVHIENHMLRTYLFWLKSRSPAEAENLAVDKAETLERLRDLAASVRTEGNRSKLPELLLYIITRDYSMFR
jgi:hypothetical protein